MGGEIECAAIAQAAVLEKEDSVAAHLEELDDSREVASLMALFDFYHEIWSAPIDRAYGPLDDGSLVTLDVDLDQPDGLEAEAIERFEPRKHRARRQATQHVVGS